MSTDSKSFKDLKEEALLHWQKNLELINKMDWSEWLHFPYDDKICMALHEPTDGYPFIGSKECAFCHYFSGLRCTHEILDSDKQLPCPLRGESMPGNCSPKWVAVREALCIKRAKKGAIKAVQAMINSIKEIPDDYGTKD